MTPSTKPTPKLICTDFDGTIHDERTNPPIALEFEQAISELQAKGTKWVINTGRDLSSVLEEIARSGLHVRPDFLVVVEREIFIHQQSQYVAHTPWNHRCENVHADLFGQLNDEIPKLFEWVNENFNATVYADAWSPFCLIAEHVDDTESIVVHLEKWSRAWPELAVVRNDVYARLSHIDFNKGTALREVATLSDAGPENIFVAGDHFNDLPMLKNELAHGLAVPANALREIKEVVEVEGGFVASGNASIGVVEGLKRWLSGDLIRD
jgi:hydroxymethylpyrimidine pyrophosphatase-like HAD family hydrolase